MQIDIRHRNIIIYFTLYLDFDSFALRTYWWPLKGPLDVKENL
jgi:hypothetical protein